MSERNAHSVKVAVVKNSSVATVVSRLLCKCVSLVFINNFYFSDCDVKYNGIL